MKEIECLYYLHGTEDESPETLEDIFNNGLKNYYGTSMHSTMYPISNSNEFSDEDVDEIAKKHCSGSFKSVFIIKVPRDYSGTVIHRDGFYVPVPLLKKDTGYVTVFTPHLISKVYNKTIDSFISNPNFSPVFDPSGNIYTDEQITAFYGLNQLVWANFARQRKEYNAHELFTMDKANHTFDNLVKGYSNRFNTKPTVSIFNADIYAQNLNNISQNKNR